MDITDENGMHHGILIGLKNVTIKEFSFEQLQNPLWIMMNLGMLLTNIKGIIAIHEGNPFSTNQNHAISLIYHHGTILGYNMGHEMGFISRIMMIKMIRL
jgi:hypothetical protein